MRRMNIMAALAAVWLIAAYAEAATYQWDGGSSSTSSWQTASNWRNDTIPPLTGNHDIYIRAADLVGTITTANWNYGSASTASYGLINVVCDASNAMTLQKSGAGSFTATGRLSLTGSGSSFPATLDADANLTVTGLSVYDFAVVDVASGVTVTENGTFILDALSGDTSCNKIGSGTLSTGATSVLAGNASGEDGELVLTAGTVASDGASVQAAQSVNATALIKLAGGTLDLDADELKLAGGNSSGGGLAWLDFDSGSVSVAVIDMHGLSKIDSEQSFTVGGDLSVSVASGDAFATSAQIDMVTSTTLDVNGTLTVDGLFGQAQLEKVGAGAITLDHISLTAGNAAGEHALFVVTDGNVSAVASSTPTTTIEAANTVDADATLQFNGTGDTLDLATLNLRGGSLPGGGGLAMFDYDLGSLTSPDAINMYGLCKIDTEQNIGSSVLTITVNGSDTFATDATLEIAGGKSISPGSVVIGDDNYACTLTVIGPGKLTTP